MSMTQGSMVAKSAQLQLHVDELLELVGGAVDQHTPIHEVERKTLQVLLQMGRTTLQILLDELGSGDVGESVEVEEGKKTLKRSQETGTRKYTSIFGTFELERYVYAKRTGAKIELVPLDARLGLPESKFSYLL